MECNICNEKINNIKVYYCCMNFICCNCYNKITDNCPYCRTSIKYYTGSDKIIKIFAYIELGKAEKNSHFYIILAKLLNSYEQKDLAALYLEKTTNTKKYRLLAEYYKDKDKDKAIDNYEKDIDLYNKQESIFNLLSIYYKNPKIKLKEIEELFNKYKLTEENEDDYYCFKAQIAYSNNNFLEAENFYNITKCNCYARIRNLYEIYKRKDEHDKAEKILLNSCHPDLIEKFSITKRIGKFLEKENNNKKIKLIEDMLTNN